MTTMLVFLGILMTANALAAWGAIVADGARKRGLDREGGGLVWRSVGKAAVFVGASCVAAVSAAVLTMLVLWRLAGMVAR